MAKTKPSKAKKAPAKKTKTGKHEYYVYQLVDPRDDSVFYIGKGKGQRAHQHVKEVKSGQAANIKKSMRIVEILAAGMMPRVVMVHEGLAEEAAYSVERELIATHKAMLTNIAPGRIVMEERNYLKAKSLLRNVVPIRDAVRNFVRNTGRLPTHEEFDTYCKIARLTIRGYIVNRQHFRAFKQQEANHACA